MFLPYNKMNQPHVHIYPCFFGFPSHLRHHGALGRVPGALQQVLISYLSIDSIHSVYMSIPIPQFIPHSFPLGTHMFDLYVCVSISAMPIRSSIPFFLDKWISQFILHASLRISYQFHFADKKIEVKGH